MATGMPFQETTTWIALGSALGAAVLAIALTIAVVYVSRSRRKPNAELQRMLEDSTERFEAMVGDLARELERAQDESRRTRQLTAIGSTIDLDTVLSRALEAASALPLVDAAMVMIPQDEGGPVVATLGMSADEATRQPLPGPPDGRDARAVSITYRYTADQAEAHGELIQGGLAVPLRNDATEAIGTLAVFWRGGDRQPSDEELAMLEDLAGSCGPAVENARRFREARKLADLDALTNLHNRRYFHDTLAREVARAQRYNRRLALVVFDIDDFKSINDRVGHLAGDSVLAQLAERVRSVVRGADIACRVGGDEFAVILPESTLTDAEQLYRRLQFAVSTRSTGPAERLHLSAGIAELAPEDDAVSFFERADEALFRAKETGKGQAVAADAVT
ncbi:MAG: sensor domain-containing diguanylate cyclase [Actinobacteria bacterium]|nr:sensor domain-containing diguanylate cyclase [Actinomycetota bacterium]